MTSLGMNGSVEFRFFRAGVQQVAVAGDFSEWSQPVPMQRDGNDGWWTLDLTIAPGDYRFRYVADGQWYTDFASNGVEATKTGWNSMLVVPAATVERSPRMVGNILGGRDEKAILRVA